ncbi:hypothetical protein AX777_17780 [Sphingobium yanoikuyae]|uniref:Uncharacterized protein n=1 Tax=Sphingobium yanoikuyae TaxID=13690 RepID=A0A177JWJ1_SPHYA|nr:hypothetical protein [Sphingobium yanoikuyae]OAH45473.1 hypothetical protein AX777_17780 [Sphingobium yanoikuyae]
MRYIVAFYEIDRAYGGPEEGGWWYDTGVLDRPLALAPSSAAAMAIADRANRLLDRLQHHKRPVSSVAYEGGRHRALTFSTTAPPYVPVERPIYE